MKSHSYFKVYKEDNRAKLGKKYQAVFKIFAHIKSFCPHNPEK